LQSLVRVRVALVYGEHLGVLVAEQELQQAVLQGLEARGASQRVAKRRVLERRHGRQHVPHRDQLRLGARDARQHLQRRIEVVASHALQRRGQLVQHEAHPQLRHLVHDDEQHLVVLARQRLLRGEELLQLQVFAVGHRGTEVPVHRLVGELHALGFVVATGRHGERWYTSRAARQLGTARA